MILNGYFIRKNNDTQTVEVINTSGIKLVTDGPGARRRAVEWTRNRVQGSMTPDEARKYEQIEKCYAEREAMLPSG